MSDTPDRREGHTTPVEGNQAWLDLHARKTAPITALNPILGKIVDGLRPMTWDHRIGASAMEQAGRPSPNEDPMAVAWEKRKELETELATLRTLHAQQAEEIARLRTELDAANQHVKIVQDANHALGSQVQALQAEVDRLREERDEARKRVDHWRGWARFVYMRGGPDDPTKTDGELQMAVAEAHDDHERDLGDRLQAEVDAHKRAESSVQALRQALEKLGRELGEMATTFRNDGASYKADNRRRSAAHLVELCGYLETTLSRLSAVALAALALPGEAAQETQK